MNKFLAIIMAGGRGKRMDIFCQKRPKPLLPFGGKFRVIDITLNNCARSRIKDIAVLVDYQRQAIVDYLSKWKVANPETCRLSILEPRYDSYKGNADAVFQNLEYLANMDYDEVLILAGDHIYNMDYVEMIEYHRARQADVTVGVVRIPFKEGQRFGTLTMGSDGRIQEFLEKSATPVSDIASMGIYVFNRSYLQEKLTEDALNPNSPHDFGYSILPPAVKCAQVYGFRFNGYWEDIGTVDSYYQTNIQLLKKDPGFTISDLEHVFNTTGNIPLAITNLPGRIRNSLISPGCVIDGYVENSILSPGVWVEKRAEVINSIVMDNTRVGYYSIVNRCILDEEVNIGNFCYVGFSSSPKPEIDDITLVGNKVSLGQGTAIGIKSKIMPGLRLDQLDNRFIAPGSVVTVTV
jgi:glucose-1-phosphate adenylyltransferase